jgi:uncharacterized protein (DUF983 family)
MVMKSVWVGIRRGLACRCPECGQGRLFTRYLKVTADCPVCHADNTIYPADDLPPYATILVVAHVFAPIFMLVDRSWAPSFGVQAAVWLPLVTVACLGLLPLMKGAAVGICWANDVVRQAA